MGEETIIYDVGWPFFAGEFHLKELPYGADGRHLFRFQTGWEELDKLERTKSFQFDNLFTVEKGKTLRIRISVIDDHSEEE